MPKEHRDRSKHIFKHGLMTYVVDFAKKICWLIDSEDDDDPISTLRLRREYPSKWYFRHVGFKGEYAENTDDEWAGKIEDRYKDYVSDLVELDDEK